MPDIKYFDVREHPYAPFTYFIGPRGAGKTYSALWDNVDKYRESCSPEIDHRPRPFIYLRNTDVQLKECLKETKNPFKRLNEDMGWEIRMEKDGGSGLIVDYTENVYQDDMENRNGKLMGIAYALSTFQNQRGSDLFDVNHCVYDEFIEKRRLSFDQADLFFNFYETVARNREMQGIEPFKVRLLSNSQKLGNPILAEHGLIPIIERLLTQKKRRSWLSDNKDIYIEMVIPDQSFADAKANSVLYRNLSSSSRIRQENLENLFSHDSFAHIGKRPLQEYTPVCIVDDLCFYVHKSNGALYVSRVLADVPVFTSLDSIQTFRRMYGQRFYDKVMMNKAWFCDFTAKMAVYDWLKIAR